MVEKKTLSATKVVEDIRAGATDEFLMRKYCLSKRGLQSLFQKLIAGKFLTQADLDSRSTLPLEEVYQVSVEEEPASPTVPAATETQTAVRSAGQPEQGDVKSNSVRAAWYNNQRTLIVLLCFLTPIGLYGLCKTSLFKTKTKLAILFPAAIFCIAGIKTLVYVWSVIGLGVAGAYIVYQILPPGKMAKRMGIAIASAFILIAMIALFVGRDSGTIGQTVATQPSLEDSEAALPQPHLTSDNCDKECERRFWSSVSNMTIERKHSRWYECVSNCPNSKDKRTYDRCAAKCGPIFPAPTIANYLQRGYSVQRASEALVSELDAKDKCWKKCRDE